MVLSGSNPEEVIDLVSDSDRDSCVGIASGSVVVAPGEVGMSAAAYISEAIGIQSWHGADGKEEARPESSVAVRFSAAASASAAASNMVSRNRASSMMQAGPGSCARVAGSASAGQKRHRQEQASSSSGPRGRPGEIRAKRRKKVGEAGPVVT